MTRRGAVLSCLLAPFAAQELKWQTLTMERPKSRVELRITWPIKPTDKMLEVTWSDGQITALTEAELREALEAKP